MSKEEFLNELKSALSGLPQDDADERLLFYSEMIDDRMEEGANESEAVSGIGTVDEIVRQTLGDIPITKIVKEKITPKRRLRAWEVVLIVLGFPVWFPLLVVAGAVVLSLYIVFWSLIISLWAIEVSLWVCLLGMVAAATVYLFQGYALQGIAMLGAAFFCGGLSIFMFFVCTAASRGMIKLTKKAAIGIKSRLTRKENAK